MPATIKGIYQNGRITLLEKLPRTSISGVYIRFVKLPVAKITKQTKQKKIFKTPYGIFDSDKFKKAVKDTFGAIPDLPDGVKYENQMRKKSNWERNYDW